MKKILLFGIAAISAALTLTSGKPGDTVKSYTIDTKASTVKWVGKKVTGEHFGNVSFNAGNVLVKNGVVSVANAQVDMNSITCGDIENADYNAKLVAHLKADDFFAVDKFKVASFTVSSVSPIRNAKSGENNYNVKGKLTIKGITREIQFPALILVKDKELSVKADVTFDRTQFDIKYGSKSFFEGIGDKAIYDDVLFSINLVAKG